MSKSGDSPARIFLFTEEGLEILSFGGQALSIEAFP